MASVRAISLLALVVTLVSVDGCSQQQNAGGSNHSERIPGSRNAAGEEVVRSARSALLEDPHSPDRLTDYAKAIAMRGQRREAALLLVEAAGADDYPNDRVHLALRALLEIGEAYAAIDLLSKSVERNPGDLKQRRRLFGLLGEVGRTDLMQPHYEAIIRGRQFDLAVLLALTDTSERLFPPETVKAWIRRNPSDYRLRLAQAQSLHDGGDFASCESVLREIVAHHSDFGPALGLLGRMPTLQQANDEAFGLWLESAQPYCKDDFDFWIAVADRSFLSMDYANAIACYAEASRVDLNRVMPWMQIDKCLRQLNALGETEAGYERSVGLEISAECRRRASSLLELRDCLQRFGGKDEQSQVAAANIARSLKKLGRCWEAEAWAAIALQMSDDLDPDLPTLRESIVLALRRDRVWNRTPDLTAFQLVSTDALAKISASAEATRSVSGKSHSPGALTEIRFVDETRSRALDVPKMTFTAIDSSLISTLGAGGGAIDFDLDGQSDLVFCIGGGQANNARLLRNDGARFDSVTEQAFFRNPSHGQGIAVGDYDQDGFPDVFFANVGENCLLRNNGDGTFTNASESLSNGAPKWSTGGAFVDLTGNGVTDLMVINYCELASGVDQPCESGSGTAACHPARFPADRDRLYLGDGTGGFTELEDHLEQAPGRALGLLAGHVSESEQMVLVANDMSANHLLAMDGGELTEMALPRGIAVDGRSHAQASMGIAAGDFDGDLDLDVYITGFAREYNVYYEQALPGVWIDHTSRQGLVEPTLMTVGFGVQSLDVDGDGIDELAITNGHIGDFGPEQPPLAQPFQLMRRSRNGKFLSVAMATSEPYFAGNHVGRALWRVDVDSDLDDDLVITHQNKHPTLLTNQTETTNRRIGFQLIGTDNSRDAIGATITLAVQGKPRRSWLLSGDGYMSSNERVLKFGLGQSEKVDDVTVRWPNGQVERFGTLVAGQTYVLVEGSERAFVVSR